MNGEALSISEMGMTAAKPVVNPWVVAMVVTMATFMEVLDSSIANVALPHIAGNLGSTTNESTWVLTSYLVASAVVLPMSGWISDMIGRKRFYMICVTLFVISSVLCGLSTSLPMLVICRVLQGLGGGGLQPTEQAILADTFAPEKRNMGFAIYGMAILLAPVIGPTLGGWITDNFSWHWIFFINLPIGIISLLLTQRIIHDPPYLKKQREERPKGRTDYMGISTIVLGVGFFQLALDKGQELDWLASTSIRVALIFGLGSLVVLAWREWTLDDPIINLRLLKNRNFATSVMFNFILGMVLNGTMILVPQFLQNQLGYTAERAGWALSPAGIVLGLLMPIGGLCAAKFDPRKVVAFGFLITSLSLFNVTRVFLGVDFQTMVWWRVLQVAGMPFIFIPITTLSYVGLAAKDHNQVSGISNFARNLGGAIGVSFLVTFLSRHQEIGRANLVSHLNRGNVFFNRFYSMLSHGSQDPAAKKHALAQVQGLVELQASAMSFANIFFVMGVAVAFLVPLSFLMKRPTKKDMEMSAGQH